MTNFSLRDLREKHNFTQEQMAQIIGISRPTYIRLEGDRTDLSFKQAQKIAERFNISLDVLAWDSLTPQFDKEKYRDILAACIECGSDTDGKITKTKLAKLAYLVDFGWFYNHLEPMSGLVYRKIKQWPVPDAFFGMIDELYEDGVINIQIKGLAQMIANNESPSLEKLWPDEKKFIATVCKKWQGRNTKEIVEFAHSQLPWRIAQDNEEIPYELITQEEPEHVY